MKKLSTMLWFDHQAEEAARFYTSLFPGGKITATSRYAESASAVGAKAGSVMTVVFEMLGQEFIALNGGPHFKFNEAVSFVIPCETQAEVDAYWAKLTADGGSESQCGWCKDKFGVSWQVTPNILEMNYRTDGTKKDPKKADAMFRAMLTMKKLDIAKLQEAYDRG